MHTLALLLLALSPLAQEAGSAPTWPLLRQVSIDLAEHPDFDWRAADLDVYIAPRAGTQQLRILADDEQLDELARAGVSWSVVQADQTAYYLSRLVPGFEVAGGGPGSWLVPPFAGGSMGGYYTFAQVASVLDQMAAAYPGIITTKTSLGPSIEGRQLWMVKISDNPGMDEGEPEVRFDAMHHAREPQSMQTTLWFMLYLLENYGTDPLATYLVNEREMYFVPVVNPDGYVYNQSTAPGGGGLWRKNRRVSGGGDFGVDLNRNYPTQWGYDSDGSSGNPGSDVYRGAAPASEPEIQAMVGLMTQRSFQTALTAHTFSDLWLFPWGYDFFLPANLQDYEELSELQTEVNGYLVGPAAATLYKANGVTMDHDHAAHGTMSWTPEIGGDSDGFWPPTSRIVPLAEENLLAFQRTALGGGAFVHILQQTQSEVGDGDGYMEPGESVTFSIQVRNSGMQACSTPLTATLTTPSPDALIADGSHSFGALGSFSSAGTGATPLQLDLLVTATPGTAIPFNIALAWEGYVQDLPGTILVGEPRPFLTDNVELDLGWLAGLPSDTASTGEWEFGNPIGTSSSGEASHPEDDHSILGVNCFSTGNTGGSAGSDDVDDGLTTLITPRIDLSGVGGAVLSYARWYADLSTEDDVFQVSISNDDGVSWTSLENVTQNANSWDVVSFQVTDFLPQTAQMRLRFIAEDDPNNSLVEGAIDELLVEIYDAGPRMNVYGRPETNAPVAVHVSGTAGAAYNVYFSTATGNLTVPGIEGPILIDLASALPLFGGAIPPGQLGRSLVTIPDNVALVGLTVHLQALVVDAAALSMTNRSTITIE